MALKQKQPCVTHSSIEDHLSTRMLFDAAKIRRIIERCKKNAEKFADVVEI
jgi:hypothetical protein